MHSVPRRNPWLVLAATSGCLVGGPALGALLAHLLAPESTTVAFLSPLTFALAFFAGLLFWFGFGIVSAIAGTIAWLFGRRASRPGDVPSEHELVPAGYGVFVPLCTFAGLLAGASAGLSASSASFLVGFLPHAIAGAAYGAALRALAHHGYLPFPEPE